MQLPPTTTTIAPEIPKTGSDATMTLHRVAAMMLLLGGTVVLVTRRRRPALIDG